MARRKRLPPRRGAITAAIHDLALRPQGVSGKEIAVVSGQLNGNPWSGSAGWRVGLLELQSNGKYVRSDRIYRDDNCGGRIGYALIPVNGKTPAVVKAPRRVNRRKCSWRNAIAVDGRV